MRRWLFTVLSAVSLVLCLATAGMAVRSYWACDVVVLGHNSIARGAGSSGWDRLIQADYHVCVDRGIIKFGWQQGVEDFTPSWLPFMLKTFPPGFHLSAFKADEPDLARFAWLRPFTWRGRDARPAKGDKFLKLVSAGWRSADIPAWLIVLVTLVLPAAWAKARLSRPMAPGICACGYDLRAKSRPMPRMRDGAESTAAPASS